MPAPCAPVFTLRIPVNQVVVPVRTGHVPHLPLAVVVDQVGFIHASALPVFGSTEHGILALHPLRTIPLRVPDRVGSSDVLPRAGIVDALYPPRRLRIPTRDV